MLMPSSTALRIASASCPVAPLIVMFELTVSPVRGQSPPWCMARRLSTPMRAVDAASNTYSLP